MHIFYFDEAGCTTALSNPPSRHLSPILVIAGIAVDAYRVRDMTRKYIDLKRQFFPKLIPDNGHRLTWILPEIKGAELRKIFGKSGSRNPRRTATMFTGKIIELLEQFDVKIIGKVWVKGIDRAINPVAIYSHSVQYIFKSFNALLAEKNTAGMVIGDSREARQNAQVAHGIFTQKHSSRGDHYAQILELPTFGHSENSAGLQLADIVASGILYPMAIDTFCPDLVDNVHVRPGYKDFKARFCQRVKNLQFTYFPESTSPRHQPRPTGGVICRDHRNKLPSGSIFRIRETDTNMGSISQDTSKKIKTRRAQRPLHVKNSSEQKPKTPSAPLPPSSANGSAAETKTTK